MYGVCFSLCLIGDVSTQLLFNIRLFYRHTDLWKFYSSLNTAASCSLSPVWHLSSRNNNNNNNSNNNLSWKQDVTQVLPFCILVLLSQCLAYPYTVKMVTENVSETLVHMSQSTRRHFPEDWLALHTQKWPWGGGTDNLGEGGFVRPRRSVKFFLYFPKEGFSGKDSYTIWRLCLTVGGRLVPVRLIKSSKPKAIVVLQVTPW
jgi:hypothetical protein